MHGDALYTGKLHLYLLSCLPPCYIHVCYMCVCVPSGRQWVIPAPLPCPIHVFTHIAPASTLCKPRVHCTGTSQKCIARTAATCRQGLPANHSGYATSNGPLHGMPLQARTHGAWQRTHGCTRGAARQMKGNAYFRVLGRQHDAMLKNRSLHDSSLYGSARMDRYSRKATEPALQGSASCVCCCGGGLG